MRIEALENFNVGDLRVTAGDIITVDDKVGQHVCAHGWAKDAAGTVPTGTRVPGVSTLSLQDGAHTSEVK
jgi:hypothetical protein